MHYIYISYDFFPGARCHMLKSPGCNVSLYRILDYEEAGWFYHAPFRACRPFYAPNEALCQQNRDLPLTRSECEDVCGKSFARVLMYVVGETRGGISSPHPSRIPYVSILQYSVNFCCKYSRYQVMKFMRFALKNWRTSVRETLTR